jgi:hypothetical protein
VTPVVWRGQSSATGQSTALDQASRSAGARSSKENLTLEGLRADLQASAA